MRVKIVIDEMDKELLAERISDILESYALFDGSTSCYYFPCIPASEITEDILKALKEEGLCLHKKRLKSLLTG